MCPAARYLSLVIRTAERKRELLLLLPGKRCGVIRQHTRWRISAIPKPMPSLSISNLLDRTSPPDYMTTDHKLPTSGPLTSVLQPSRKACIFNLSPSLCKRGQVRDPVARRLVGVRPQSVP